MSGLIKRLTDEQCKSGLTGDSFREELFVDAVEHIQSLEQQLKEAREERDELKEIVDSFNEDGC